MCQIGGWSSLWLAEVVEIPDLTSGPVYPLKLFLSHLTFYGSALFLTHGWRSIILHLGWKEKPLRAVWWRALLGTAALACIHCALNTGMMMAELPPDSGITPVVTLLIFGTYALLAWIEFTAWTGIYLGYHAYVQLQELRVSHEREEGARKSAELQALKAQINPHFLFNSLNTVRSLIFTEPTRAGHAVTHLSQILRASLDTQQEALIPLAREMEVVSSYLQLEQLRHEERLKVKITISPDTIDCLIPPFAIQTLVENAIKHGIDHLPAGGEVCIESHSTECGSLKIIITNPGVLREPSDGGHGLANTRERLRLLGGETASLVLFEDTACQTIHATLSFPIIRRATL